jgi:hypothetical protein
MSEAHKKPKPSSENDHDREPEETRPPVRHRVRPPKLIGPSETESAETPSVAVQQKTGRKEYEVGYRKPPEHTRFKKGQSGNPKGRPKGSQNTKTLFRDELNKKVTVRAGGHRKQISKREAVISQLINKALGGHDRSIKLTLEWDEKLDGELAAQQNDREVEVSDRSMDEDDRKVLDSFVKKIREDNNVNTDNDGATRDSEIRIAPNKTPDTGPREEKS